MKNLYKILFIVVALIFGSSVQSEAQTTKRLFKQYRKAPGVMGMNVNGMFVDIAIAASDMDRETKKALKKMTKGVGFIIMEDADRSQGVVDHFGQYLKEDAFESLVVVKSDGEEVDVKLRKHGDHFREMVIFINAEDSAVGVFINGKFDTDDVRRLARAVEHDGDSISFNF